MENEIYVMQFQAGKRWNNVLDRNTGKIMSYKTRDDAVRWRARNFKIGSSKWTRIIKIKNLKDARL